MISCLEAEFFSKKVLQENFSAFSQLFHLFVKEGYITIDSLTRFYYTYVLTLKDLLENQGTSSVGFNELVHVIWSLATTEDESLSNPMIPRLYERLHDFKRPEKSLTKEELLELYQLQVYAQDQIKVGRWPKEFKEVIPQKVRDVIEEEHSNFDKNLYADVQVDIAKKLLKLRATFQENTKVSKSFRVDFKLLDVDKVILLKGNDQVNPRTSELLGLYSMKYKFLSRRLKGIELVVIDVERWKQMEEEDQYAYLYNLSRFKDTQGSGFDLAM